MYELRLPHHVRFCEVAGQRIFLDLKADRYFSLPPPADAAFSAILGGRASAPSDIAPLLSAGLLIEAPAGRPLKPTSHPPPEDSFMEDGEIGRGLSPLLLAEVLFLVLRALHGVRRKRLHGLLAAPTAPRGSCQDEGLERRDQAVAQFLRARRAVPVAPNCLYDSLALRGFLARRSIPVDLVIGTKLHPFAAHCWLQDRTTVLNDSLAAARGFTPILVT
ncbi:MAG: hypothetical protein QOI38_1786 [Sphingomonadales bacterium]|jgi:hypothetical protein|nr:hypothetical protein [Sphingomonadales bacterium]